MNDKWKYISEAIVKIFSMIFNSFIIMVTLHMCINYSMWWILLLFLIAIVNEYYS